MGELREKITTETLVEKIPAEKCWAITAKVLVRLWLTRDRKYVQPLMGEGEGIMAPVLALEKWREMSSQKAFGEHASKLMSWIKKTFNVSVEDAIGAAKLRIVVTTLQSGPEMGTEIVEATPERTVVRTTKCVIWEMYKELGLNPELAACDVGHQAVIETGLKTVNPKITHKLTKAMSRGDPYCEDVFEFKEK